MQDESYVWFGSFFSKSSFFYIDFLCVTFLCLRWGGRVQNGCQFDVLCEKIDL